MFQEAWKSSDYYCRGLTAEKLIFYFCLPVRRLCYGHLVENAIQRTLHPIVSAYTYKYDYVHDSEHLCIDQKRIHALEPSSCSPGRHRQTQNKRRDKKANQGWAELCTFFCNVPTVHILTPQRSFRRDATAAPVQLWTKSVRWKSFAPIL